MAVVDEGRIGTRGNRTPTGLDKVCGTCGVYVAYEHVQRHIDWHNTALTETVTAANHVRP